MTGLGRQATGGGLVGSTYQASLFYVAYCPPLQASRSSAVSEPAWQRRRCGGVCGGGAVRWCGSGAAAVAAAAAAAAGAAVVLEHSLSVQLNSASQPSTWLASQPPGRTACLPARRAGRPPSSSTRCLIQLLVITNRLRSRWTVLLTCPSNPSCHYNPDRQIDRLTDRFDDERQTGLTE